MKKEKGKRKRKRKKKKRESTCWPLALRALTRIEEFWPLTAADISEGEEGPLIPSPLELLARLLVMPSSGEGRTRVSPLLSISTNPINAETRLGTNTSWWSTSERSCFLFRVEIL